MPVTVKRATRQRQQLRQALLESSLQTLNGQPVKDIEVALATYYAKTTLGWEGETVYPKGGYTIPVPDFEIKAEARIVNGTIVITVRSLAVDNEGNPHKLWYWLDFGTDDFLWNLPYPSKAFVNREFWGGAFRYRRRLASVTGEVAVIKPGRNRPGIVASNWSRKIAEDFANDVADGRIGNLKAWVVTNLEVANPLGDE